ncbi:hypothetical protein NLI96_g2514 [Meripilus lineatus]|uniref:Uncharacterized protein n=1 Tax=Meripilus lineatus TaxID=2056292 RepID=A0AAD5VAK6_9APHY|nr:hypothetical protein NLI96_g2514 [Physisporinus lineatus]
MRWKLNWYFVSIWVIVNILSVIWWIFYVIGSADPTPHSTGTLGIFALRTLIVLGFWSIPFNLFPAIWYIRRMRIYTKEVARPSRQKRTFDVNPWIVYPFWITIFSLPIILFFSAYGAWAFDSIELERHPHYSATTSPATSDPPPGVPKWKGRTPPNSTFPLDSIPLSKHSPTTRTPHMDISTGVVRLLPKREIRVLSSPVYKGHFLNVTPSPSIF